MKKNSNSDPILVAFEEQITWNLEAACKFAADLVDDKAAAEDIVSEKVAKFWAEREALGVEKLKRAYFFEAVRNACINYLERHVGRFKDLNDYMVLIDRASTVAEFRAQIHFLLKNLEPHHKRVVEMRFRQGLKLREIAEELGMSTSMIHNWLREAVEVLKRLDSER